MTAATIALAIRIMRSTPLALTSLPSRHQSTVRTSGLTVEAPNQVVISGDHVVALALEARQVIIELSAICVDFRPDTLDFIPKIQSKIFVEGRINSIEPSRPPRSFEALAECLKPRAFEVKAEPRSCYQHSKQGNSSARDHWTPPVFDRV